MVHQSVDVDEVQEVAEEDSVEAPVLLLPHLLLMPLRAVLELMLRLDFLCQDLDLVGVQRPVNLELLKQIASAWSKRSLIVKRWEP
jgi:hypothetical protein